MHLSAKTLSDVIKSLRSNASRGMEKRKQPRVGLRARADIRADRYPNERLSVWVRDVSAGGIQFTCPKVLNQGDKFTLVMGDDPADRMACSVTHAKRVSADLNVIGGQFADEFPTDRDSFTSR
jgi:hypothetical protein